MIKFLKAVLIFVGTLIAYSSGPAAGQTDWSEVPEMVSASFKTFAALFRGAHDNMLGITILGDSQETVSGGGGATYIPAFNQEFFRLYGNIPKSGTASSSSYPDGWLLAGASAGIISNENDPSLPAINVGRYDGSSLGLLAQFISDGSNKPGFTQSDGGYFNGNSVTPELILRARPGSSEVNWRVNVNDTDTKTYFGGTDIATGTTSLGLNRIGVEYVTVKLGTYDLGTHKSLQVIAHGNSNDSTVDIVGIRFVNSDDSHGVSVQSLSKGGFTLKGFLNEYESAGQIFKAIVGEDIIAIQYGANDTRVRTATQFKSDLAQVVVRLRDWAANPDLPILLISDPDRGDLNVPQRKEFEKFPGVAAEIAMEYSNVLALNTRRLGAANGWTLNSEEFATYTSDQVHYTDQGARLLAKWQVDTLLRLAAPDRVLGDGNGDGITDFGDIGAFFLAITDLPAYRNQYPDTAIILMDMNGDGMTDFGDIEAFFTAVTAE